MRLRYVIEFLTHLEQSVRKKIKVSGIACVGELKVNHAMWSSNELKLLDIEEGYKVTCSIHVTFEGITFEGLESSPVSL